VYKGVVFLSLSDFAMVWGVEYCYEDGKYEEYMMPPKDFEQYINEKKSEIVKIYIAKSTLPTTLRRAVKMIEKAGIEYEVLS